MDCSSRYISRRLATGRVRSRRTLGVRARPHLALITDDRMQLTFKCCIIRPWRLDDAESLVRHANNRRVWIALRDLFPHPYTIENAHSFLKSAVTSEPVTLFCIEADGVAVGGIGIRIGADVHRQTAELGYWLGEEVWGRGIMTEAVAAFTDFCFEEFQLRRIYAEPFANNHASARVLEKTGFALEGRLKNNVVKDGKLLDSLLYARTK